VAIYKLKEIEMKKGKNRDKDKKDLKILKRLIER